MKKFTYKAQLEGFRLTQVINYSKVIKPIFTDTVDGAEVPQALVAVTLKLPLVAPCFPIASL